MRPFRAAVAGAVALIALLTAHAAHASCVSSETLDDAIQRADTIFVATILQARLEGSPDALKDRREFRTTYAFRVAQVIRGNPDAIQHLYSTQLYHGTGERPWTMAAERSWSVGDSVLVIADKDQSVNIGACSWSAPYEEMREEMARRGWNAK